MLWLNNALGLDITSIHMQMICHFSLFHFISQNISIFLIQLIQTRNDI